MKTLYLHGDLVDLVPKEYHKNDMAIFECDFNTPKEAISFLEVNFGNIYKNIKDKPLEVLVGNIEDQVYLDENQVNWKIGAKELHIIPYIEGSKSGNIGKVLLGVTLITVAAFASGGTLAGLSEVAFGNALGITGTQILLAGVGLVFNGLAGAPETPAGAQTQREPIDQRASSIYGGPLNTQEQGGPVPYVAGTEVIVGGVIIHADLKIEQL